MTIQGTFIFLVLFSVRLNGQITIPFNSLPSKALLKLHKNELSDSRLYAIVHTNLKQQTRLWIFYDTSHIQQIQSVLLEYFFYPESIVTKQVFFSKYNGLERQSWEEIDFLSTAFGETTKAYRNRLRKEIRLKFPTIYPSLTKLLKNSVTVGAIRQSYISLDQGWLKSLQLPPTFSIYSSENWLQIQREKYNEIIQKWAVGNYESDNLVRTVKDNLLLKMEAKVGIERFSREFEYDNQMKLLRIIDRINPETEFEKKKIITVTEIFKN